MEKCVIGTTELVTIKNKVLPARIDTGAKRSSIDLSLAKELGLTQSLWGIRKIKSSNGNSYRPLVKSKIKIKGKKYPVTFNIAKRLDLKYSLLIGRDVLKGGFLIDASL